MKLLFSILFGILVHEGFSQKKLFFEQSKLLQQILGKGWNTWDTFSQVDFVHLPDGKSLNLMIKEYQNGAIMRNPMPYQQDQHMILGAHSDDGSYISLKIVWKDMTFQIESCTDQGNLLLLITPLKIDPLKAPCLIASAGILWQRNGYTARENKNIFWHTDENKTTLFSTVRSLKDPFTKLSNPYSIYSLKSTVGLCTGKIYSIGDIAIRMKKARISWQNKIEKYDSLSNIFEALQSSIAWNTIYDPQHERVITPVSRSWNEWHNGYVLFDWDNYFVAYMTSLYNKQLSYANAIAITDEIAEGGFIPNFSDPLVKSEDRSEPPVGSFCVREIYRRYKEKWLLELLYDRLLKWNRWWAEKRDINGLLVWGSNLYKPRRGQYWESKASGVNERQGASFESGMDNAPMYFDVPFENSSGKMEIWDVGLNSLYILDCQSLSDIASILGKKSDVIEINNRKMFYSLNLEKLWDEKSGIFKNKFPYSGIFSDRMSPTSFYTLLTDVPGRVRAERMINEHFFNKDEYFGEWMIPSVPKSDTSFKEQNYWRGRIWPPMNFLVYLGLKKYNLTTASNILVEKSKLLLLRNWDERKMICENYNSITGIGGEKGVASDPFYFWGALLGFMDFIDKGNVLLPVDSLAK